MAVARARSWCATPVVAGPVVVEAGTGGADHHGGRGSWEAQGTAAAVTVGGGRTGTQGTLGGKKVK